jgi:ABC-type branched-subunit amino acid transport system substrate-binding protein
MRKRHRLLIVVFVLALIAAACSSDGGDDTTTTAAPGGGGDTTTTTQAPDAGGGGDDEIKTGRGVDAETKTIKLGLLADLTGIFAPLVIHITDAQQIYWDNVNAAGGIDGWTVELVVEDTNYNLEQHQEKYQKLREEVVAISQSTGSPTNVATLDQYIEDSMLVLPLSWFSGWPFADFDGGVMIEQNTNYCLESMNLVHFAQDMGGTKINVVGFPGDYGQDAAFGAKAAIDFYDNVELGYDGEAKVIPGQDYTEVIQGIATSGADWTILTTNASIGAEIIAGAVGAGYTGLFTGSGPTYNPVLLDSPAGPLYDTLYYQSAYNVAWGEDTPGNNEMMAAISEALPDARPQDAYIIGWNESIVMHEVIKAALAAKDLTPEGMVAASNSLADVDFGGSQPNQSWAGTPDDFVQRGLAIYDPDLATYTAAGGAAQTISQADATTGSLLAVDFFVGDAAAAYEFSAPCYEL